MNIGIAVIAALGVAGTILALWRVLTALRSGAPRDLVLGWLALMIVVAAGTTIALRFV